jgi:hypothetical protein
MKQKFNLSIYFSDFQVINGLDERLKDLINIADKIGVRVENISASNITISYDAENGYQTAYDFLYRPSKMLKQ